MNNCLIDRCKLSNKCCFYCHLQRECKSTNKCYSNKTYRLYKLKGYPERCRLLKNINKEM